MREEPVVFLGMQACAPRSANNLNENVEHLTSIQGYELDAMESRLRDDCAAAAAAAGAGGTLGVYYQLADGSNEERQLAVPPETSMPVRAAYEWMNQKPDVPQLTYHRVPIADETAPEEQDFDQLVRELRTIATRGSNGTAAVDGTANDTTALVFNCQMGRGRTTTGMVVGSIMLSVANGWEPPPDTPRLPEPSAAGRDLSRGEFRAILELSSLIDRSRLRRPPPVWQRKGAVGAPRCSLTSAATTARMLRTW
jgi:hypothetical protein